MPEEEAAEVERLYRERYAGFTARHFHDYLVRDHGFRWDYTWTKTYLHEGGLLRPRRAGARTAASGRADRWSA